MMYPSSGNNSEWKKLRVPQVVVKNFMAHTQLLSSPIAQHPQTRQWARAHETKEERVARIVEEHEHGESFAAILKREHIPEGTFFT